MSIAIAATTCSCCATSSGWSRSAACTSRSAATAYALRHGLAGRSTAERLGALRVPEGEGVVLAELGRSSDAIKIFSDITTKHPELPEPHNNLAVLHAAAGELDAAKAALDQALRVQPDHAQAQENLGDVLVRLALRAYQHAQKVSVAPGEALAGKISRTLALTRELTPTR